VVRHLSGADGSFLFGPQGNVRVLEYIAGTRCLEVLENPAQGRRVAASFGRFSRCMQGVDPGALDIVIPDFHSPAIRWSQFMDALEHDRVGRSGDCPEEVAFALDHERDVRGWQELMDGLPLRICHNDCKINNLLIHKRSGEPIAIIDLDTCMPGRVLTEFGDLVRSCSSAEPEDSTRLEKITARPEVYRALLEGYLEGWQGGLAKAERDSLLQGALMMCFILGLRFLNDFIEGDRYFSVLRPRHNLERARNQFQLFRSLVKQREMFAGMA
jgi:Ser/Thr protein kinase RdoA (MazF antagonist)